MAKSRNRRPRRRAGKPPLQADLQELLAREFEDWVTLRSHPDPANARASQRYAAAFRRVGSASHPWAVGEPTAIDSPDVHQQTLFDRTWRDLVRTHASNITPDFAFPVRRAAGLYDYYPARLQPPHAFSEPFSLPFTYRNAPKNVIALTVPQIHSGMFSSSLHAPGPLNPALVTLNPRPASAMCGTFITIDPRLHDAAHGAKDVVVWAEGTLQYDYTLGATPGPRWNSQPEAASVSVAVLARLVRYDRQTGKRVFGAEDFVAAFIATQTKLYASLIPNGHTSVAPSEGQPVVGGPYAAWSSEITPFRLGLADGTPRMLSTDSFYYVAVVCAVFLDAKGAGPAPEDAVQASVSAQMFLRLVTLGIRPHDPKVW